MTREQSYSLAFERQSIELAKKKMTFEQKIRDLNTSNQDFVQINTRLSQLGTQLAIKAISGDENSLKEMQSEIAELSAKRSQILKEAKIKNIKYDCDLCLDTGYINGKICDCIHTAAKAFRIDDMSKRIPIYNCRFENFDLGYYSTEKVGETTPKKRMSSILELCKNYVIQFDPQNSDSLLFMGKTGLGKTHLTLAIVYELLSNGFNVMYDSAYNMFGEMEKEHFEKHTNGFYKEAIECDLLVIDDLGGEFVTSYVQSLLYNIINTRILAKKPTIINTNLAISEIEEKYTPRVSSRFVGDYKMKRFIGNDIRQLKTLGKKA